MTPSTLGSGSLNKLSIASTVVDAGVALSRGNQKRAAILMGAAVLASRVKGIGTAASILVRVRRKL